MIYRNDGFYRYRKGGIEFVPLQSERHPITQFFIDLFCIAWWCFFASVTGLGILWALFVCLCVAL